MINIMDEKHFLTLRVRVRVPRGGVEIKPFIIIFYWIL